jgi:hypothetical protein
VDGESSSHDDEEHDNFSLKEEPVKGGNWNTTVVFLPDGTARDNVKIVFQIRGCRPITLRLRGLTGDVSTERESR